MIENDLEMNQNAFLFVKNKKCFLINCENGKKYSLNEYYYQTLLNPKSHNDPTIIEKLIEKNILVSPEKNNNNWPAHEAAYFFHQASRYNQSQLPIKEDLDLKKNYKKLFDEFILPTHLEIQSNNEKFLLPKVNQKQKFDLLETIEKRKTVRNFNKKSATLEDISWLLEMNFSSRVQNHKNMPYFQKKIYPSATGLGSLEAIFFNLNIKEIPKGISFYDQKAHALIPINNEEKNWPQVLSNLLLDQVYCKNLSCGVMICGDLQKNWAKSKDAKSLALFYLEAGHCSQNLLLLSTALGFSTWITAAIRHDIWEALTKTKLPEFFEEAIFIGLGYSDDQSPLPSTFTNNSNKNHVGEI